MPLPWRKNWPGRLQAELRALRQAGIRYEIDRAAFASGILRLGVWPVVEGETIHLIVTYPALFPFFRFDVVAPELRLSHHQHAASGSLCLWGRATDNWEPDQTLAGALVERLPLVLPAGRADLPTPELAAAEEDQAEPFSDYYPYPPGSIVLVDGSWTIDPTHQSGRLLIGVEREYHGVFRGVVLEVQNEQGRVLAAAEAKQKANFPLAIRGRWVRVPEPVRDMNCQAFIDILANLHPDLEHPREEKIGDFVVDLIGVCFPEERAWRAGGDGWVFIARVAENRGPRKKWRSVLHFVRPGHCGRNDLTARTPELASLRGCCVAQAGLGGIGAPSALEFARAGMGRLKLLDHDVVDPATAIRWPLGFSVSGMAKTAILARLIEKNWPYTTVSTCENRLGTEVTPVELERLQEWLDGADLIYDATAELGVQYYLSEVARKCEIPYVCLWTRQGIWGGLVARIDPRHTRGCWLCLQHALDAGDIPGPPFDPAGRIQPLGCADPTFSGSSFDLNQLAAAGVRMAVSALTFSVPAGYPGEPWDILLWRTRDDAGRPVPPAAQSFSLGPNPNCPRCGRR